MTFKNVLFHFWNLNVTKRVCGAQMELDIQFQSYKTTKVILVTLKTTQLPIEHLILDTNAGKQLSYAATDV